MNENKIESKTKDNPFGKFSVLWILIGVTVIGLSVIAFEDISYKHRLNEARKELASRPKSNIDYSYSAETSLPTPKEEFESAIKDALNDPSLPAMCERVYFNNSDELIIEVNGEWIALDDGLKEDMIYSLKELLKEKKEKLGVEGYGQFFSTSGQPLESFYAK